MRFNRPLRLLLTTLFAALITLSLPGSTTSREQWQTGESGEASRPNILIIMTDDQRYDTMDYMPRTKARIFDAGVTFTHGYVTTSLCCPSRSSLLTGMYAHNHGVQHNRVVLKKSTLVEQLQAQGYFTGIVGKYLNSWNGDPRPEFDDWVSHQRNPADNQSPSTFYDPPFNDNGVVSTYPGYLADVYQDFVLRFLDRASNQPQPFLLLFTPIIPHQPADPAPGDEGLYADLPPHRPASYNEADVSDKPGWLQGRPPLSAAASAEADAFRRKQLQTLHALDKVVDRTLDELEQQGKLDNTFIVYLSDNGYLWGEHRLQYKNFFYEEAIRVPFAIRYPPLITPRTEDRLVANIDIAPTVYDLLGLPIPSEMDGRSLLPLLRGERAWREDLIVENWYGLEDGHVFGIHTDRYVYAEKAWDRAELYDLQTDPLQMENRVDDPAYAATLDDLRRRLAHYRAAQPNQDTGYDIMYGAWRHAADMNAASGGYLVAAQESSRLQFSSQVAASSVGLVTYRGPDQGKVRIIVDDTLQEVVDLYAPVPEYQYRRTYHHLPLKAHTIKVQPLGQRSCAAQGADVRVDGFDTGFPVQENHPWVSFDNWEGEVNVFATGAGYRYASSPSASLSFTFKGTGFTWITARGPAYGKARVVVDDALVAEVDLYAKAQTWQHRQVFDGFADGIHTVRIQPLGTRNNASRGSDVVIDGFNATLAPFASLERAVTSPLTPSQVALGPTTHSIALPLLRMGSGTAITSIPTRFDDGHPGISYDGWLGETVMLDCEQSYRVATAPSVLMYDTTTPVDKVSLITYRGPDQGKARIWIDGVEQGVVDLYSPAPEHAVSLVYDALTMAPHRIAVEALRQASAVSRGAEVRIGGVRQGDGPIAHDGAAFTLANWSGEHHPQALGGSFRVATQVGATVTFKTTGESFTWITARGPDAGQAQVVVDGVPVTTIDLYSPIAEWQHYETISGLSETEHTVQIIALGARNDASSDRRVVFDGLITVVSGQ